MDLLALFGESAKRSPHLNVRGQQKIFIEQQKIFWGRG